MEPELTECLKKHRERQAAIAKKSLTLTGKLAKANIDLILQGGLAALGLRKKRELEASGDLNVVSETLEVSDETSGNGPSV